MENQDTFFSKSYDASANSPADVFQSEKIKRPQCEETINELEVFYNQKLFCQFMEALTAYTRENDLPGDDCVTILYSLVLPLHTKLSMQGVVELIRFTTTKLATKDALLFIQKFEPLLDKSTNVYICLQICKANVLIKGERLGEACDILFSDLAKILENKIGVDLHTNSCFYQACVNYYRVSDNPRELYDTLTLYLAYTQLHNVDNKPQLAFELCVAGLIAPSMFDFGELQTNAILTTLKGDVDREWILEILDAAVEGSLTLYKSASQKYPAMIQKTFGKRLKSLEEKITLAALIELAFQQPKTNRKLAFDSIVQCCDVDASKCERLLMKAMSLNLLKGRIDGASGTFYILWVKPRLVDAERVGILKSRFVAWSENLGQLITHLENSTRDILAS